MDLSWWYGRPWKTGFYGFLVNERNGDNVDFATFEMTSHYSHHYQLSPPDKVTSRQPPRSPPTSPLAHLATAFLENRPSLILDSWDLLILVSLWAHCGLQGCYELKMLFIFGCTQRVVILLGRLSLGAIPRRGVPFDLDEWWGSSAAVTAVQYVYLPHKPKYESTYRMIANTTKSNYLIDSLHIPLRFIYKRWQNWRCLHARSFTRKPIKCSFWGPPMPPG